MSTARAVDRAFGRGGLRVAPLSFGAAAIGNLYAEVADDEATDAVHTALAEGIDYFDTAPHYGLGLSERRLGTALGGRSDVVVSTKVGRVLRPGTGTVAQDSEGFAVAADVERVWDFSRDGVLRSIEESLRRLGRDHIDVVYVHDPDEHFAAAMDGAFPALDELRRQGVISSYGAGMNQSAMLTRFVRETDLDVVLVAGRYTVLDGGAAEDLLPACLERDVSVAAGGVFNSGISASAEPGSDATYDYLPASPAILDRARRLAALCREYGTTLPHAAVHFPLRHPAVRTVLVGMRSPGEVRTDLGLLRTPPPEELWAALEATS
ncbi:aldo/keto reductase [Tsukamurella pulmonis]|uniref:aldo/keto reductase n=1 Tax=Tsukamurella pulmonis TaxID=47312 RepID=UPI000794970F|nr:aldo/keto reductase [Tsukamurella pulmonis]KXP12849.1 aldo/keto reductase [Tsukamurella pulmonis]RDH11172.1 aldo/keto reductase [Tsukamurella pulmonis]